MAIGAAQAAPMTGGEASGADDLASTGLSGTPGRAGGAPQISTGNRSLDRLLDAGASGSPGSVASAAGAGARESGRAASAPGLRAADLRQTIRAEAATQSDAKSVRRGDEVKAIVGLGDTGLNADASERDPTTRRRWEAAPSSSEAMAHKPAIEAESAVAQATREAVEFLRAHRVELFAVLGLLMALAVMVKLYIRRP